MRVKIKKYIESIIDKSDPKLIDKISYILFGLVSLLGLFLFLSTFRIIKSPILTVHPKWVYSIEYILTIGLFFLTMLGEKVNKPVQRPKVFFLISLIITMTTYSLLSEIFNNAIITFLETLIDLTNVPNYLITTNVRIITVYIPLFIVLVIFFKTLSIPFIKEQRKELREYSIDLLTRNVEEVSHRTVNLKICEDIATGEDIILTEKGSYRHCVYSGSSGSGKTSLAIRPELAQLFYQKAIFREKLKELSFECLNNDICYLKAPVTNKFINDNFNMDLIGIKEEKREEFLEIFKDYIIGIRDNSKRIYHEVVSNGEIRIPLKIANDIKARNIVIKTYYAGMISDEYKFRYEKDAFEEKVNTNDYSVSLILSDVNSHPVEIENQEQEHEVLVITIDSSSEKIVNYKFEITVDQEAEGKIIYRDIGITTVAPDGGLPEETLKIARANGVFVHKIDPKMEEIQKGNIAKFNPILVGTPEKAADVLSSILVSMEQSSGKDSNPYFVNASIRAIRNIVIILRVMHPKLYNTNPTLEDVLNILNNFNLVTPYVEEMRKDPKLSKRWKSVIDYFITSFYPQPLDNNGKAIANPTGQGTKTKKVTEAIGGIINQLDNFLGREEIRYILCDRENSLNLSDVLENGECLAIATRQSELGDILGKAFALMFILSMQNAVLCRYSEDENPEIPFKLYIDEFPFYLNDQTKVFFTFSRKYKCSITAIIQNIAQLCEESEVFKQIVLSNTGTKLILPGANVEDRKYFSEFLGFEEVFETQTGISQNPIMSEKAKYTESTRGGLVEKAKVSQQELAELQFKRCFYSYTNSKGKTCVGKGFIDFLKLTDENTVKTNHYDFEQFNNIRNKADDYLSKYIMKKNLLDDTQESKDTNENIQVNERKDSNEGVKVSESKEVMNEVVSDEFGSLEDYENAAFGVLDNKNSNTMQAETGTINQENEVDEDKNDNISSEMEKEIVEKGNLKQSIIQVNGNSECNDQSSNEPAKEEVPINIEQNINNKKNNEKPSSNNKSKNEDEDINDEFSNINVDEISFNEIGVIGN